MAVARMRVRDPAIRRQAILLAAGKVFVRKGFRSATMEEIAAQAGIGVGTLYHYFKSKEHLFTTLLAESTKLLGERLRAAAAKRLPPALGLVALLRAYVDYFVEFPEYFRIQMSFTNDLSGKGRIERELEKVNQLGRQNLELLADKIREGQKLGLLRRDIDPMAAATTLWASYTGILFAAMNQPFLAVAGLDVEQLLSAAAFVQFAGLNADSSLAPVLPVGRDEQVPAQVSISDLQDAMRSLSWLDPGVIFSGMRMAFQPERAAGVEEVYRFELTGPRGGNWTVAVHDGALDITRDAKAKPTVTLSLAAQRFIELATGQVEAGDLIVRGEMKISGDLQRAARLQRLFSPASPERP